MNVKIIKQRGQSALVEYTKDGKLERRTVPVDTIADGAMSDFKLKLGVPYGVEWSKLVTLQATPEQLQQNLRQAGVWTGQDATNNAQKVLGIIQKTYGLDLGKLLKIAKEAANKEAK